MFPTQVTSLKNYTFVDPVHLLCCWAWKKTSQPH